MEDRHDQSAMDVPVTLSPAARQAANATVRRTAERLIAEGREIGVQVAAYLDGELVIDVSAGVADPATGRPVDPDTLFHVFSVTKGVLVTALHMQAERGRIDLDDSVMRHWPEYGANGKAATTIRQVLQHRSGLPMMPPEVTPELMCDWEWMVAQLAAMAPIAPPGTRTFYQSMTHGWLVGEIVRRESEHPLSLEREITEANRYYEALKALTRPVDPSLEQHVESLQAKALDPIRTLEKKLLKAEKRKYGDLQRQVHSLKTALFPTGGLQERVENFMPWYAQYGPAFIDDLYAHSPALDQDFIVLSAK